MLTQSETQGLMEQVRGRVMNGRALSPSGVYFQRDLVAFMNRAFDNFAAMDDQLIHGLYCFSDLDLDFIRADQTLITDLTAAFGIKGCALRDDLHFVTGERAGERVAFFENGDHRRFCL